MTCAGMPAGPLLVDMTVSMQTPLGRGKEMARIRDELAGFRHRAASSPISTLVFALERSQPDRKARSA